MPVGRPRTLNTLRLVATVSGKFFETKKKAAGSWHGPGHGQKMMLFAQDGAPNLTPFQSSYRPNPIQTSRNTMMRKSALLALVGSAAAFAPAGVPSLRSTNAVCPQAIKCCAFACAGTAARHDPAATRLVRTSVRDSGLGGRARNGSPVAPARLRGSALAAVRLAPA